MASNNGKVNNNNTGIQFIKRWLCHRCHILTLFVVFCCNTFLPIAASTVVNRVDSNTQAFVNGVALFSDNGGSVASKGSADILLLPPHAIEKAGDDLKVQLRHQLSPNYRNSTANRVDSNNKSFIHYQSQLQPQITEHLRHYNHRHYTLAPANALKRYILPPLRHHRHQEQVQHDDQKNITLATDLLQNTTSPLIQNIHFLATEAPLDYVANPTNDSINNHQRVKPHRFYDRDALYQKTFMWTTKSPKEPIVRKDGRWKVYPEHIPSQNERLMNGQRISLYLDGLADGKSSENEGSLHDKKIYIDTNKNRRIYDVGISMNKSENNENAEYGINSNSKYDDYSYNDSNEEEEDESSNEFQNHDKYRTAVKRYTNPFNELHLKPKKRNYSELFSAMHTSSSQPDAIDNDNSDFSNEKWQHIEEEHYRKQKEHQQQMLALRARHDGKYRTMNAAATTAPAIVSTETTVVEQQRHNDDKDPDNYNYQNYIPGTLTRQKQEELGTLAAVHESRRTHVNKHKHDKALAGEHVKQILSEAACRVPQRRVERIQRDPSKLYMPHCTVLYRCTEETGCCRSERQICAPKHTANVDLYFYVRSINEKFGTVERLTLVNHTECHCVERARQKADEYHSVPMYDTSYGEQALRRATILNCNCPKLYEKILQEDGFCRCDCSSGNTGCDWLKRGMEHFSMIDRKCISEGHCKPPTCEHGNYIKKYGRCPRREEQLSVTLTAPLMLATNELSRSDYH